MRLGWLSLVLLAASVAQIKPQQSEQINDPSTTPAPTAAPKNATYWLTLSQTLRGGQPLNIVAKILSGNVPVTIIATIVFQKYGDPVTNRTLLTSAPVQVYPGAPQTISIDIPYNITEQEKDVFGSYFISVNGTSETINFIHVGYLILQYKPFSIFVQTNKPLFKPGETVKFRALALEPGTLKVLKERMDIYVTDPKGNKVQQFLGVSGESGVVEQSMKLADSTLLGDWTITVVIEGQTFTKPFTVADYVLPTFEVKVITPSICLSDGPPLPITVKAKHTFGKPLTEGDIVVHITVYQPWSWQDGSKQADYGIHLSGQLDNNGEYRFEVNSKQLMNVLKQVYQYSTVLYGTQFEVKVNVTDKVSQRVQSASTVMQMYQSPLSATFLPISPNYFKPGLNYTSYIKVDKVDGTLYSPPEAKTIKLYFNVTYEVPIPPEELATTTWSTVDSNVSTSSRKTIYDPMNFWRPIQPATRTKILPLDNPVQTLPETGLVTFSFFPPEDALSCTMQVKIDKPSEYTMSYYISRAESPTNSYIQISAPTETPKVGQTVPMKVESTEPLTGLTFQVVALGQLVSSGTVNSPTPEGSKNLTFNLEITQIMSPSITIVVFTIRESDSQFVVDTMTIGVEGLLKKSVSIEFSEEKVKPGDPLYATIKAKPQSTVFLVANDKSVELLKSDYGISSQMIQDDQLQYNYNFPVYASTFMFRCGWPFYPGGLDAQSSFELAGMLVFTDGEIYHRKQAQHMIVYDDMVVAESRQAAGGAFQNVGQQEETRIRRDFPENWLWRTMPFSLNSTGEMKVPLTSPDTVTSWVANIFAVHPTDGLTVGDTTVLTTFMEMFISTYLPPFLIRYEGFCFTASVFNYYQEEVFILLTLEKSSQFNGTFVTREGDNVSVSSASMAFTDGFPDVGQNEVRSSTFCITPLVTGAITLKLSAVTNVPGLSDKIEQVINVKPEGVGYSNNYPFLVNMTNGTWSRNVEVKFPSETVPDSQRITVSIVGNLMGCILENIADLLRMPYGCGEQNMLNYAPNIYLLRFMFATNTITPETLQRAKDYMVAGFQTEMTYMHDDTGGFSAFGKSDKVASHWLTAFVLRCFAQGSQLDYEYDNVIGINATNVIVQSVNFVISNQNKNGSFSEYGIVFHVDMQGGSAHGEALTAYTILALIEASKVLVNDSVTSTKIERSISLALNYLAGRINYLTDVYDICIITYALHLANHPNKDIMFMKMEQSAKSGDAFKYWERPNSMQDSLTSYQWSPPTSSMTVEMTAYALLTYHIRKIDVTDGLSIMRWLITKMGPNGAFMATQDTVIGLEALTKCLSKLYTSGDVQYSMTVSFVDGDGISQSHDIKINKANEMMLQKVEIPYKNQAPSTISITAVTDEGKPGPSTGLLLVTAFYNVKEETLAEYYKMSHELTTNGTVIELNIYIASVITNSTSMTILQVEILAGYTVDENEVKQNEFVSRVDPYDGEKLTIYFHSGVVTNKRIRVQIRMYKTSGALTKAEPRSYSCWDYYNRNYMQTKTYTWEPDPYCTAAPDAGICQYM